MKRAATLPARVLWNAFFWTYERATWQYDLMVIAILAFVWLTPPDWLNDPMASGQGLIGWTRIANRSIAESAIRGSRDSSDERSGHSLYTSSRSSCMPRSSVFPVKWMSCAAILSRSRRRAAP